MKNQQKLLFVIAYIAFTLAAIVSLRAQEPRPQTPPTAAPSVPDGSANQISDWALAGVIWSDASLTKKLATEAARRSDSPEHIAKLELIADQSSQLIQEMEAFGWKQVRQAPVAANSRQADSNQIVKSNKPPQQVEDTLPSPEQVGDQLAESLDRPNVNSDNNDPQSQRDVNQREDAPPVLDPSIKRFDTESPPGMDDPGVDDERTGVGMNLDVDQYRVDDYIDETGVEARSRADAIEDGVEGAIAAASGRLGTGEPATGRISDREIMTRSKTLPVDGDSIYDSEDYDPDVDYDPNNPNALDSEPANRGDFDDDIDLQDPAEIVDGEDEFIASAARSTQRPVPSDIYAMDRYTQDREKYSQDANWVQFYLDSNEAVWQRYTDSDSLLRRTDNAWMKLRAHANVAANSTNNPQFRQILQTMLAETPSP